VARTLLPGMEQRVGRLLERKRSERRDPSDDHGDSGPFPRGREIRHSVDGEAGCGAERHSDDEQRNVRGERVETENGGIAVKAKNDRKRRNREGDGFAQHEVPHLRSDRRSLQHRKHRCRPEGEFQMLPNTLVDRGDGRDPG